jgi:hypothetical protein
MVRITDGISASPSQGSHLSRIVDRASASASFSPLPLSDRSIDFYVLLILIITQQVGDLSPSPGWGHAALIGPCLPTLVFSHSVCLTWDSIDSVLNWTVQCSSAAGNGETPANVHDPCRARAGPPVPFHPSNEHIIFGDFPKLR